MSIKKEAGWGLPPMAGRSLPAMKTPATEDTVSMAVGRQAQIRGHGLSGFADYARLTRLR